MISRWCMVLSELPCVSQSVVFVAAAGAIRGRFERVGVWNALASSCPLQQPPPSPPLFSIFVGSPWAPVTPGVRLAVSTPSPG